MGPTDRLERVVTAWHCPVCRKRRLTRVDLGGMAMGRQRLRINLVSLVVKLSERGWLPIGTIQW